MTFEIHRHGPVILGRLALDSKVPSGNVVGDLTQVLAFDVEPSHDDG